MKRLYQQIVTLLASTVFGWAIIVLAAFQGIWIAVSSRYPMAFDEAYHYNLIKLHSDIISPIIYQQPAGQAPYGALARDPSQLYHFLLSIPYRLLESVGASEFVTVVTLRMFSVAMFCWGLFLFRKLLLRTKASAAAVHAALLFFILIPTVPLLAGQLNYDNLQFPLVALTLLSTASFAKQIVQRKSWLGQAMWTVLLSLLGALNKFTFLPIMAAVFTYMLWMIWRHRLHGRKRTIFKQWQALPKHTRRVQLGAIAILAVLFCWYYGVNTVLYQNPVVQCHQVIDPSRCASFEPWERNYKLAQTEQSVSPNPLRFSVDWTGGMFYRLFFTINGATGPKRYTNHVAMPIAIAAAVLSVCGAVIILRYSRRILAHDPVFVMILFAGMVYVVSLWGRNFNDYLNLGQMVAINGRYLHPILLPFILLLIAGYQHAFRLMPGVKLVILLLAIALFSVGGGITGFIHYSDADWYFEGQVFLVKLNDFGRRITAPLFLWRA